MPTCELWAHGIAPANDRGSPAGALREGNWRLRPHSLLEAPRPCSRVLAIRAIPHAPRRFAPVSRAISVSSSSRPVPLHSALASFTGHLRARPRSAQVPGLSNAVFLAVPVELSTPVPSKTASVPARSPRRGFPGRLHPRSTATFHSLCLAVTASASPYNPASSGLRFAALARR